MSISVYPPLGDTVDDFIVALAMIEKRILDVVKEGRPLIIEGDWNARFDLDDPKIFNLLTCIRALEFHLQDDQLPERWYKALITSIVNPSAIAWALSHLDLPGTLWTSIKAIFFNHFVLQSFNFMAYKKLCYLQAAHSISEKISEMCNQIILLPLPDFLSTLCNTVNKDLQLCLTSAFATNPPNDFNEAVVTAIAMEASKLAGHPTCILAKAPSIAFYYLTSTF
ncbi:hypothetical protein QOT17_015609 [Balamuthia mandrillaris]